MAFRNIVTQEDAVLHKQCRTVEKFDQRLWTLLDDMKDTLYKAQGYGLAAPQVGILKRVAVIDVGEGYIELINPEITDVSGTQRDVEGCLSCPETWGYVTRPYSCTLKAQDRNGNYYEKKLTGLFCRCACHETDHLSGKLFTSIVDEFVKPEDL
ncbi:MAG: peptide deformylase [Oscillospiraceae bacterium]|nr:peptide deformylase [Oscillospiraceae bacterium]